MTWLSMDAVAGTVLDAAFSQNALAPSHNVVHPRPIAWSQMTAHVQQSLKKVLDRDLPIVTFGEWFSKLEALANQPDVSAKDVVSPPSLASPTPASRFPLQPGVKLLEFFRGISAGHGMGAFSTSKMEAVSETLRRVEPLAQRDADAWVQYWKESGLL